MTIGVICSTWVMIYFNPIFSPRFRWLIWCTVEQNYHFWYSILYRCISLRSSINCYLFSGDVYLLLGISLSSPLFSVLLSTDSEVFRGEVFQIVVILLANWSASVENFFAWSKSFWRLNNIACAAKIFTLIYFDILYFQQNTKIHNLFQTFDLLDETNSESFFIH